MGHFNLQTHALYCQILGWIISYPSFSPFFLFLWMLKYLDGSSVFVFLFPIVHFFNILFSALKKKKKTSALSSNQSIESLIFNIFPFSNRSFLQHLFPISWMQCLLLSFWRYELYIVGVFFFFSFLLFFALLYTNVSSKTETDSRTWKTKQWLPVERGKERGKMEVEFLRLP